MDLDRVAPELRAKGARPGGLGGSGTRAGRAVARTAVRLIPWPIVPGVRVAGVRAGPVRVRAYRPAERRTDASLLWIHGGGMIGGAARVDDRLCSEVAARLGIEVVGLDYRLAPEHPFPAPLDDCAEVFSVMRARAARAGLDPARIVVGGQSAGGGLAAMLTQRLRASGGPQPLGQWLFCPMLDDRTAADARLDDVRHFVWDNAANRFGWRSLLGREPGSAEVPEHAVPARAADLAGLPPAWIGTGDLDLFHDEDLAYAGRLAADGVEVVTDVVAGAPHAFETLAPDAPQSQAYRGRALAWLGRLIGAAVHPAPA